MAGYENIKDHGFDKRTAEERRELAIKAGVASGEARRKKADFRKTLNLLLTSKIDSPEWTPVLESLGVDSTLEAALNMAMIKEGLMGNVKAYEAIAKYSGQSDRTRADEEEQRIRTERARRARDQEIGETDEENENIQSFLHAIRPSQEDIENIFAGEGGEESDAEEDASAGEV